MTFKIKTFTITLTYIRVIFDNEESSTKCCFLFGHHDCPFRIQSQIEGSVLRHYLKYGIRHFYIGNRGAFDSIVLSAVKTIKRKYDDITLFLLLPYHPAERTIIIPEGFDETFFPPLYNIPRKFAIVHATRYMIDSCDTVICYVNHSGNAEKLLKYALHRSKTSSIHIENLAI